MWKISKKSGLIKGLKATALLLCVICTGTMCTRLPIGQSSYLQCEIKVKDLSVIESISSFDDGTIDFIYMYPQLCGLPDSNLQVKCNNTLQNVFTGWVEKDCKWISDANIENSKIVFLSDAYLVVAYVIEPFSAENQPKEELYLYCTIDLSNGTQVFLNDLISVEEPEFLAWLDQAKNKDGYSLLGPNEDSSSILNSCCVSAEQYVDMVRNSNDRTGYIGSTFGILTDKPDFYMLQDYLVIKHTSDFASDIYIELAEIEQYWCGKDLGKIYISSSIDDRQSV